MAEKPPKRVAGALRLLPLEQFVLARDGQPRQRLRASHRPRHRRRAGSRRTPARAPAPCAICAGSAASSAASRCAGSRISSASKIVSSSLSPASLQRLLHLGREVAHRGAARKRARRPARGVAAGDARRMARGESRRRRSRSATTRQAAPFEHACRVRPGRRSRSCALQLQQRLVGLERRWREAECLLATSAQPALLTPASACAACSS